MKKPLKVLLIIVLSIIVLGVILFFIPTILNVFSKDSLPPNAPDLQLSIVNIPEEDNSYYDLIKLKDSLKVPKETSPLIREYIEGKKWDDAKIAQLLEDNKEALLFFEEASKKSAYQDPAEADPSTYSINTILPPLSAFRTASEISALKALHLAKQGNVQLAIDQSFQNLTIAGRIEKSQGFLIQYLVSIAIKTRGLTTLQNIVNTSDVSTDQLNKINMQLSDYYDDGGGLERVFKSEFIMRVSTLDMLAQGIPLELIENIGIEEKWKRIMYYGMINGKNKNFYFQPNKTKEYDIDYTREMISRAGQSCEGLEGFSHKKLAPNLSPFSLLFTENAVGKILHDVVSSSLESVFDTRCSSNFQVSAVRMLTAIKAYKNDTGEYPASLNDLVPANLSYILEDPYSGNDIKYSPAKKIIYSVGKGGIDVGGSEGDIIRSMENPTIKIGF